MPFARWLSSNKHQLCEGRSFLRDTMKTIHLTQEKIALVDDEDYESLIKYNWCAVEDTHTYYARARTNKVGETIAMHRYILGLGKYDRCVPLIVHHINHNGLDNRKKNLRVVTYSQNLRLTKYKRKKIAYKEM